jgi:PAS domain S-box-containing protein
MSAVDMSAVDSAESADQASEIATLYTLTDRLYRARSVEDVYAAALDAIVGILGCKRASILLFDAAGVMRFVAWRGLSADYRERLNGHTPWSPGERDPQPIFVSNIDDTNESAEVKATIKKEGIRALAFIPLMARGGCVGKFMTYYEAPRPFTPHEIDIAVTIARQVGFCIERLLNDRELRDSEERFRLMCEHAPVMIWMSDVTGKCLHLNKMLRDFWGVAEDELDTFDWGTTMHPDDIAGVAETVLKAMTERTPFMVKARYRDQSGRYRVLQTDGRPRLTDGRFVGMIGVNTDVTEREEADAARRQAEQHRELLIAELNHRVKNTLSVVQAIAHQTFQGTAEDACLAFNQRLVALARSHDLLTHANWSNITLESLATSALQLNESSGARVKLNGPPVLLKARQAVAFGMAFHELFTNALKYGALSNAEGGVSVQWTVNGAAELQLSWREHDGPPVSPPKRRGFGSLLLERILHGDLSADVTLDYQPSGLVCTISAPLPD